MRRLRIGLMALALMALASALVTFTGRWSRTGGVVAAAGSGLDLTDLDTTCMPCQDFYKFATGGWTTQNPIQPDYPSWGRFNVLQDKNQEILHQILEDAANDKNAAAGSVEQKIGDFYSACMDTKRIESDGVKPIEPDLKRIAAISNLAQFQDEVAHLQSEGIGVLFVFSSSQDSKDSTQVIGLAMQGGLGLPVPEYYIGQDTRAKQVRDAYDDHVTHMFELAGDSPDTAAAEAKTVFSLELQMAQASKRPVELRDPQANYHKLDAAALSALTPDFSWAAYFRNMGFPEISEVNVGQPEFFQALDKELTSVPLADWKTYLRWHLLHAAAPALSAAFEDENFAFYGRTLTGATELQPRWKRCVQATDRNLGEALGQKYVEQAFPPEAKDRARVMVQNLVAALRSDLETLPWMSQPTRQQALAKLAAMTLKIGYPDKWRDYSALQVTRGPYLENLERGSAFELHREMAEIGKPVDRTEWEITPPTVNAYYNPNMNELVFPAGILQPPFFDPNSDDALNYGGMGSFIGHEMTHGFDDQGRQYDAQGNLRNWWTPEDLMNFQQRAQCVEEQFNGFAVADDLHENGKLVLGEAIADLGGVTLAHIAFERSLAGKPAPDKIDGYTAEQRFFIGWARVWAATARPEYEHNLTIADPHPLPRFRAVAPLMNMVEFAGAFSCESGDAMVRPADQRCKIW